MEQHELCVAQSTVLLRGALSPHKITSDTTSPSQTDTERQQNRRFKYQLFTAVQNPIKERSPRGRTTPLSLPKALEASGYASPARAQTARGTDHLHREHNHAATRTQTSWFLFTKHHEGLCGLQKSSRTLWIQTRSSTLTSAAQATPRSGTRVCGSHIFHWKLNLTELSIQCLTQQRLRVWALKIKMLPTTTCFHRKVERGWAVIKKSTLFSKLLTVSGSVLSPV